MGAFYFILKVNNFSGSSLRVCSEQEHVACKNRSVRNEKRFGEAVFIVQ